MPRQNRVTPFSTLIATPARGALTGNRGCLHDELGQIRRAYQGQRWIICLLEFKGRKRAIMQPGHYTELFFLDEATAFAAGHRPCAECQRDRFNLFRELWATANPDLTRANSTLIYGSVIPAKAGIQPPTLDSRLRGAERDTTRRNTINQPGNRPNAARPAATVIDAALHSERMAPRTVCNSIEHLPAGTFITDDEQVAYLVLNHQLLRWSPAGYESAASPTINYPARVLTPPSIVRTLAAGYPAFIHSSAFASRT